MCVGGKAPKDNSAEIARQQEEARQQRIRDGQSAIDTNFAQFNDPYFDNYRQEYMAYYQPQLDRQFQDAKRKAVLGLHRTGNLSSSAGAGKLGELTRAYNDNRTMLANNALSAVNDLRGRIEESRNNLYSQNRSAADPSAAASQAAAQAGYLGAPPTFSPLGQLFGNFTNMAMTGLAAERAGYPGFNTGLFNNSGSGRVVGG